MNWKIKVAALIGVGSLLIKLVASHLQVKQKKTNFVYKHMKQLIKRSKSQPKLSFNKINSHHYKEKKKNIHLNNLSQLNQINDSIKQTKNLKETKTTIKNSYYKQKQNINLQKQDKNNKIQQRLEQQRQLMKCKQFYSLQTGFTMKKSLESQSTAHIYEDNFQKQQEFFNLQRQQQQFNNNKKGLSQTLITP